MSAHDPNSDLNRIAQQRFEAVKSKLKFNLVKNDISFLEKENIPVTKLDDKKIQEVLNNPSPPLDPQIHQVVNVEKDYVDNTFAFIESLNLPPQLSLAIGYIISGHKTSKVEDIEAAIKTLEDYRVRIILK